MARAALNWFIEAYFSTYPGAYFTGDGARRDEAIVTGKQTEVS